jgi:MFS-type transporter involved in bile tolerance (Atg22 family)
MAAEFGSSVIELSNTGLIISSVAASVVAVVIFEYPPELAAV